ncbi:hypothetical protein Ahy_B02g058111 isoform B [Arachis hypogaea]|uniref:Uncharacterized protein n=1 Tax=Arachis hypogaea TaxID=3818 RepID=A0A445ADU7_ARAHY|nr:hypothetical protein Ahy_B02g058111 isoform A [Arachis hypogaea]RYR24597.1 hypothetical protein Ahy_B02g058111 isoform B [Arachis hypogaea]
MKAAMAATSLTAEFLFFFFKLSNGGHFFLFTAASAMYSLSVLASLSTGAATFQLVAVCSPALFSPTLSRYLSTSFPTTAAVLSTTRFRRLLQTLLPVPQRTPPPFRNLDWTKM